MSHRLWRLYTLQKVRSRLGIPTGFLGILNYLNWFRDAAECADITYVCHRLREFLYHNAILGLLWRLWVFLELALSNRYPLSALYTSRAVDASVKVNWIVNFRSRRLNYLSDLVLSVVELYPLLILLTFLIKLILLHPIFEFITSLLEGTEPGLFKVPLSASQLKGRSLSSARFRRKNRGLSKLSSVIIFRHERQHIVL